MKYQTCDKNQSSVLLNITEAVVANLLLEGEVNQIEVTVANNELQVKNSK
ncbi:hypothetical protein [Bacillus sp. 165]|nr:hypothetical protein [Bacillus sp. 165]MBO9129251.1 hypothetical protein [Bacillus sp. 165]